eukprot:29007-Pelagococcus_subviridis.AAC.2
MYCTMSTSDCFASPSGSPFNAASAMSASSLANVRASSIPTSFTIAIAFSRSPSVLNCDSTSARSDASRRSAKIVGAVRFPLARSCPCGFPSCSSVCVKSKMSSTT